METEKQSDGAAARPGPLWRATEAATSALGRVAGAGILAMAAVTCLDVILRRFGSSVPGAYDIVRLLGGVVVAAALPRTTAVKGHVAIEYFFHRLGASGRLVVDSMMRSLQTAGFGFAAWALAAKGASLLRCGEVTPTLRIPIFWLAWTLAASCALSALVSFLHLIRPRRAFQP